MKLKVSENGRFLCYEDETPFFFLGDTAWELIHRLNREEIEFYLENRSKKGFNVIQTVILAEKNGLETPNAYGHIPLIDNDPLKPYEAYFEHVDWVVKKINEYGMFVGLLPTWGDKWNKGMGFGPEIFKPENAFLYGKYLSDRYANDKIIWILGGDRSIENEVHKDITNAMGRGIKSGKSKDSLVSFHPGGPYPYSNTFHNEDWLDFNMFQSSHIGKDRDNYRMIAKDYNLTPPKPCMEDESCYEEHAMMGDGWIYPDPEEFYDEYNVRKAAYWSVFAGGMGYTYGANPIWQFWDEEKMEKVRGVLSTWKKALDLPGSFQMVHLKKLMESFPFYSRIPDQEMILSEIKGGGEHVQATRDLNGTYALVYIPLYCKVTLDLSKFKSRQVSCRWYSPVNGEYSPEVRIENTGVCELETPHGGPDWVLVLLAVGE